MRDKTAVVFFAAAQGLLHLLAFGDVDCSGLNDGAVSGSWRSYEIEQDPDGRAIFSAELYFSGDRRIGLSYLLDQRRPVASVEIKIFCLTTANLLCRVVAQHVCPCIIAIHYLIIVGDCHPRDVLLEQQAVTLLGGTQGRFRLLLFGDVARHASHNRGSHALGPKSVVVLPYSALSSSGHYT